MNKNKALPLCQDRSCDILVEILMKIVEKGCWRMDAVMCMSLGYVLGSFSSADFISKWKRVDLRKKGSGNLGATNTLVVLGFRSGVFVLLFDLLKTIFANRLAKWLFPHIYYAGLLAACGAVIGHIFPFYLKFQGGKGVACLAGMIMSFDFGLFVFLLAIGVTMMIVLNYGIYVPVAVAAIFPFFVLLKTESVYLWFVTASVGALIIHKHKDNFKNIREGKEIKVRKYFLDKLLHGHNGDEASHKE